MEKLRQLLNDYEDYKEKETWYSNYDWRLNEINDEEEYEQWITAFRVDDSQLWVEESIAVIICKGYMFINWLVENDKIDRDNARLRKSLWETDTSDIDKIIYTIKNSDYHYVMREAPYEAEETLLMLLSISDDPVSFLISILK